MDKKRKYAKTEEPEPLCLIISPSEDGAVFTYTVPNRLITPEVVSAVGDGGLSILFMIDAARTKHCADEVAELPTCLQALLGKIKPIHGDGSGKSDSDGDSDIDDDKLFGCTELWGGVYVPGPYASFLTIYQWN